MEAVAWRVRDKDDPRGWWLYGVHETETVAELKRQEHEVQALAVIPTEGGGGRLVGFTTTGTAARTHTEAREGPITRADFGPQGPEGDARFAAYTKGENQ